MSVLPWHHYTHMLHSLPKDSGDVRIDLADGQVLCHKPLLACHTIFLKNILLHNDTDSIMMPDFGKEDFTNLVDILYGRVSQASVSNQLLKALGIAVLSETLEQKRTSRSRSVIISKAEIEDDIGKNYQCHNCSNFFSSQANLCTHIEACGVTHEGILQGDAGEVIYQCSLCSLLCTDLEELHNHMDVHSKEGFADEDVVLMEEDVENLNGMEVKSQDNVEVVGINREQDLGKEVITEELVKHEFLITDEDVEVQDPSIDTTEVIVSFGEDLCQDVINSNTHSNLEESQKENVSKGYHKEPQTAMLHDHSITNIEVTEENRISEVSNISCQFCENDFDSMDDLNAHTVSSHFSLFQNYHLIGGERLSTEDEDDSQLVNQEQRVFYRCTLCENSFDTIKALSQHVATIHETKQQNILPVSCCHCSRTFIKRSFLAKHYRKVHQGLQQIFQCPDCGKIMKAAKTLENHELMHTGVKPFQCGFCQVKFYNGSSLGAHTRKGCRSTLNFNQNTPLEVRSRPTVEQVNRQNKKKCTKNEIKLEEVAEPKDQFQFYPNIHEGISVDKEGSNSSLESNNEYSCDVCSYKTSIRRKNDFKRHLETRRHKENCEKYMKDQFRESYKEKSILQQESGVDLDVDDKTENIRNISRKKKKSKLVDKPPKASHVDKTFKATQDFPQVESSEKMYDCPGDQEVLTPDAIEDSENLEMMANANLGIVEVCVDDYVQEEVISENSNVYESPFAESVMKADFVFDEHDQVIVAKDNILRKNNKEFQKEQTITEDNISSVSTQIGSSESVCIDTESIDPNISKESEEAGDKISKDSEDAGDMISKECEEDGAKISKESEEAGAKIYKESEKDCDKTSKESEKDCDKISKESVGSGDKKSDINSSKFNQSTASESPYCKIETCVNVEFGLVENPVNPEAIKSDPKSGDKEVISDDNQVENSFPTEKVKNFNGGIGRFTLDCPDSKTDVHSRYTVDQTSAIDTHSVVEASVLDVDLIIDESYEGVKSIENDNLDEQSQKVGDNDPFVSAHFSVAEDLEHVEPSKLDSNINDNLNIKTPSSVKKKDIRERISKLKVKSTLKRKREVDRIPTTSESEPISTDKYIKTDKYPRNRAETYTSSINIEDMNHNTEEKKPNINDDSETPSKNQIKVYQLQKLRKIQSKLGVLKAKSDKLESKDKAGHPNKSKRNNTLDGFNCDICPEQFGSRRESFVHMLSHVPASIRAKIPEGNYGWCPQCPGPVEIQEVDSHVANCHPVPEIEEISVETDPLKMHGDEMVEIQPCDRNSSQPLRTGTQDLKANCSSCFVKLMPLDLSKYRVNVKDYM